MAKYWVMSGTDMVGYATIHEAMQALRDELDKRAILVSLGLIERYPIRLCVQNN